VNYLANHFFFVTIYYNQYPITNKMFNVSSLVYLIFLFYVLSPNVLLRIPPNGSKHVVALVHAVVFAVVYYYTSGYVSGLLGSL
jgi:hypothetical protein